MRGSVDTGWASNSWTDKLEPNIETCDQAGQGEPLEGVAIVLVDVHPGLGPVAQQPIGWAAIGGIRLEERHRPQGSADLLLEGSELEILPNRPRVGTRKLIELPGRRGNESLQDDFALGRLDAGQMRAIAEVAAYPAALHDDGRALPGELERREHIEAGPAVHGPVVEEDRVLGHPGPAYDAAPIRQIRCDLL